MPRPYFDTDTTFDDGRARMTLTLNLGNRKQAEAILADYPAEVFEAYLKALADHDRETDEAADYRYQVCVTYEESRGLC